MLRPDPLKITIDGIETEVEKDTTILQLAKQLEINIPTLCHHDAITTYGACRVCTVEVKIPRGGGKFRSRMVTACNYPIRDDGLVIDTKSEKVISSRKMNLELLLARCPNVKRIQELAKECGITESRFPSENPEEECILCGLCTRVCQEIIGKSAISLVGRGFERKVLSPFDEPSSDCIACGACAYVCPTGAIKIVQEDGKLTIKNWKTSRELSKCLICGEYVGSEDVLQYIKEKVALPEDIFQLCEKCRRKKLQKELVAPEK